MFRTFAALPCFFLAMQIAYAAPADGDAIRSTLIGNTVEGEMQVTGSYSELYAEDGSIHGKDHAGSWRIRDDRFCRKYAEDPAECYEVEIDGASVTWRKDGETSGTGTIIPGNPNGY